MPAPTCVRLDDDGGTGCGAVDESSLEYTLMQRVLQVSQFPQCCSHYTYPRILPILWSSAKPPSDMATYLFVHPTTRPPDHTLALFKFILFKFTNRSNVNSPRAAFWRACSAIVFTGRSSHVQVGMYLIMILLLSITTSMHISFDPVN